MLEFILQVIFTRKNISLELFVFLRLNVRLSSGLAISCVLFGFSAINFIITLAKCFNARLVNRVDPALIQVDHENDV